MKTIEFDIHFYKKHLLMAKKEESLKRKVDSMKKENVLLGI